MKLCLGTVQFGLNYGIQGNGQPQEEKVFDMLSYAINNGIDILDTASAYGEAERVLGEYFGLHPEMRGKTGVVSKLKPDAFEDGKEEQWAEIAVQNAKASLERLGVGKLTAYLFHNAAYIFKEKAVNALYEVKSAGLTERIGVSIYTPEEAMKALDYPQIKAIQVPYNLFDRRLDECGFFEKVKEKGVLVFARSSLLQGLAVMDPDNLPERVSFAKSYIEQIQDICQEYDKTRLEAAIGYVGGKPGIDYVVFGVDNIEQLSEYVSLQDVRLPNEMIKAIDKTFENVEERLVNPVLWK